MVQPEFTPAVDLALRAAADFASACGASEIQLCHFLYGLLSFGKALDSRSSPSLPDRRSIEENWHQIVSLVQRAGFEPQEIRRCMRDTLRPNRERNTAGKRMHRAPETKSLFEEATSFSSHEVVSPLDFLRNLSQRPDLAGLLPAALVAALRESKLPDTSMPRDVGRDPQPDNLEDIEISLSFSAASQLPSSSSSAYSNRFSVLCEATWQQGLDGNLQNLLHSVTAQLLSAIATADTAAVLERDVSGQMLLKAYLPSAAPYISSGLVEKTIREKTAVVWQRREQEITQSLAAGQFESGIYVPLIANDNALGVICLHSQKPGQAFSSSDLQLVIAVAHQMSLVLANRQLADQLKLKTAILERLLTNFAPQTRIHLVQRAQQGRLRLGGERSVVTILASDIRGFTRKASRMEAEDVVDMLNDYFAPLTDCIFRHQGTVDKYIGDAILAVFGSPETDLQHCEHGVLAALEMQDSMAAVNRRRAELGRETCDIGIGVHTGEVVHGFIGSSHRMEFTVIGDTVNIASRLCDAAAAGQIVVSPEVHQRAWSIVLTSRIEIQTKHEGKLPAHRIEGRRSQ